MAGELIKALKKNISIMNLNNFTIKSQEAVQHAVELVQSNGQQVIETPHLFKALLTKGEDVIQFLFGKLGINKTPVEAVTDSLIAGFPPCVRR